MNAMGPHAGVDQRRVELHGGRGAPRPIPGVGGAPYDPELVARAERLFAAGQRGGTPAIGPYGLGATKPAGTHAGQVGTVQTLKRMDQDGLLADRRRLEAQLAEQKARGDRLLAEVITERTQALERGQALALERDQVAWLKVEVEAMRRQIASADERAMLLLRAKNFWRDELLRLAGEAVNTKGSPDDFSDAARPIIDQLHAIATRASRLP